MSKPNTLNAETVAHRKLFDHLKSHNILHHLSDIFYAQHLVDPSLRDFK